MSSSDHVMTTDGGVKQQLTVIARHKKRGEESLNKFKEEVRKFAVDHTFKETAKKFGIHHSTVSGWVKESEKADKCANFGDFYREKGKPGSWLARVMILNIEIDTSFKLNLMFSSIQQLSLLEP